MATSGSRRFAKIRSSLTKQSSSGIHNFELAFEHIDDIFEHIYTPVHYDSHVSLWLPIVHSLCFGVTLLNCLLLLQGLTDFTEIR